MRTRLVLIGTLLLLAALAWLLLRAHERAPALGAAQPDGLARGTPDAQLDAELGNASSAAERARHAGARELRFEPLPEEPSELVVHIVDEGTGKPVTGAEVFVLEVESYDWRDKSGPEGGPVLDLEALLREHGTRVEPDEHGDLHLPPPARWLEIAARKDDRFGATRASFESLPEDSLVLVRTSSCLVRVRDAAGRLAADVKVVLGAEHRDSIWRGRTDAAGELPVPNLRWLIADNVSNARAWFVRLDVSDSNPSLRWYAIDQPVPATIDLALGEMQRLRLRVCASDGTPVPLNGLVEARAQPGSRGAGTPFLEPHASPPLPLVRGEALLAHAEPGAWLWVRVFLAGGEDFENEVRVPPLGEAPGEILLRIPEKLQVVLARATDESGIPLASRELEWVSFATEEPADLEDDQHLDHVQTDEQGQFALVLARRDLEHGEDEENGARHPSFDWRGILRSHAFGRELASAPIHFSSISAGALRDLGVVVLAPATPLVRGHVRDERGRPLAHVRVGLQQARNDSGEHGFESLAGVECSEATRTDTAGAFVLHGTCPGGTMHLNLERDGYEPPRDTQQGEFDCGTSPDLALTLVRDGALRTSVRTTHGFARTLTWELHDGRPEPVLQQLAAQPIDGSIVTEFARLMPGKYRVRLMDLGADVQTFAAADEVVVRPGLLTLDPRLLDLEIAAGPAGAAQPRAPGRKHAELVLQIRDGVGNPIPDGLLCMADGDAGSSQEWHAGRVVFENGLSPSVLTLWSPGFRAWTGPCPTSSGELRLEPSWRMRFEVEIPPEFRRADLSFRLLPRILSTGLSERLLESRSLVTTELDAHGRASMECLGEFDMGVELLAFLLEPGGGVVRADVEPVTLANVSFRAAPALDAMKLTVDPEQRAELAEALRAPR